MRLIEFDKRKKELWNISFVKQMQSYSLEQHGKGPEKPPSCNSRKQPCANTNAAADPLLARATPLAIDARRLHSQAPAGRFPYAQTALLLPLPLPLLSNP